MNKFTADVLGMQNEIKVPKMDTRGYAKYVLKNGVVEEKRELLGCLKSKLVLDINSDLFWTITQRYRSHNHEHLDIFHISISSILHRLCKREAL